MILKNRFIFLIATVFFACSTLADNLQVNTQWRQDTSDFTISDFSLRYSPQKADVFWPYEREEESFQTFSIDINRNHLAHGTQSIDSAMVRAGLFLKPQSNLLLEYQIGLRNIDSAGGSTQITTNKFFIQTNWSHWLLEVSGLSDALYMLYLPRGDTANKGTKYKLKISKNVTEKIKVNFLTSQTEIRNQNINRSTDIEGLYGFSVIPWFWLGFGGSYLSNTEPTDLYYSPSYFHSYGPRIQYAQSLDENWSLNIGGSFVQFREESGDTNKGHYILSGLRYGKRGQKNIHLQFEDIQSGQGSETWKSHGCSLNVHWPF